ncbi:tetratricopeptide repeat protein [Marivirga harenae]|uniref:tetratricopeptide repeat protein n=1 Tax=Marivirga harenae TaxID=2010992 RepID=UPI0026DECB5E|nr:tetratricopeptide repeat protein [Marivirga harenae]WKV13274.1 tetratricopeptide repeat protein [Marivirga harenae]|tara:strand:- start:89741 stop:91549 length:1809 start_codon:yes stop_codon:yes gene_type:complete
MKYWIFSFFLLTSIISYGQSNQKIGLANAYYQEGEYDKAISIYRELAKAPQNLSFIHTNYIEILYAKQYNDEAEKYLKSINKIFPANINYQVDFVDFYITINDSSKAEKIYQQIESRVLDNLGNLRSAAQYFINKQHREYAERLYLSAREIMRDPNAFAIQLATLYRYTNQKDKMVTEYLKYANERPGNLRYVKNMLQLSLTEKDELHDFVEKIMEELQSSKEKDMYSDLLIWANLQLENFYGAFMQARAIDKRNQLEGENSLEIGELAYQNEDYDIAEMIFSYVVDNFPNSMNYIRAKQLKIKTQEIRIKNHFPIDTASIRNLVVSYKNLVNEIGLSHYTLEAYRQQALLHAFYLNEHDKAINMLQNVIDFPNAEKDIVAIAKLNLGDIYIIKEQPWESVLLYYQVEKSHKNENLGENAKLKNAKLSFYKGEFELAQEHLDILKNATRREIANDAMDLSILIKNNTILDSTQKALRAYADVDLLLYQNKYLKAQRALDSLIEEYEEHPILDELLWLKAKRDKEIGNYADAISLLERIATDMPYDILTDDALFEMGLIYEELIQDQNKAKEYYQQLLTEYPGSIFVAEARKRFRLLRGDFVN